MAINLLDLQPVKASSDISSYSNFIFGVPKIGKTTFVSRLYGDRVLFLATENRHKVLIGAHVQNIKTWSDYLSVMSQLRTKKELKDRYDVVAVDTVENLYKMLELHILAKYGTTEFGQVEWGKDWTDLKKGWVDGLQKIEKAGYTPVFIGHAIKETVKIPKSGMLESAIDETMTLKTDKKSKEEYYEFQKFVPDLKEKVMAPINKMVDNILFMNMTVDSEMNEQRVIHLRESLQWQAGSTFEGITPVIPLDAEAYKKALKDAIDLIGEDQKVSEKHENDFAKADSADFDDLMKRAKELGGILAKAGRMEELTRTIEKVFGPGKKLMDARKDQTGTLQEAILQLEDLTQEKA